MKLWTPISHSQLIHQFYSVVLSSYLCSLAKQQSVGVSCMQWRGPARLTCSLVINKWVCPIKCQFVALFFHLSKRSFSVFPNRDTHVCCLFAPFIIHHRSYVKKESLIPYKELASVNIQQPLAIDVLHTHNSIISTMAFIHQWNHVQ